MDKIGTSYLVDAILIIAMAGVILCLVKLPHSSIWSRVLALVSATTIIEIIGVMLFRDLSSDTVLFLGKVAFYLCVALWAREKLKKKKATAPLPHQHGTSQRSPNDVS